VSTTHAKITSSGQLSLPAALRRRWAAGAVLVIDCGDYAIIRPVPADPVAALKGVRAGPGQTTEQARENERSEEARLEERRRAQ
jgi:bifunctional DNA-binding transcriptional regulator/antitoxin component of YhaV-PrlF toxin-antitoxin module